MRVQSSIFGRVKEALTANAESTLTELGVNLKSHIKGTWTQCLCPFCGDTSGSASITPEGFLKCHQCSRKQDVFQWYGEKNGLTPWDACKAIAQILHLTIETPRKRGRVVSQMTQESLLAATMALWEDEKAEGHRAFLKQRKLDDPQILERFGVGFMAGYLIFAQWTPTGYLRPCFRTYLPGSKPPWFWKGGTKGGTLGFWPYVEVPKDATIWILEGEWDVLTAWVRLRLQEQGIYCFTWTGGAGSPIRRFDVPEAWRGREIHIVTDNDVFQGPDWEAYLSPDGRKHHEMRRRWENLMNNVAPSFLHHKCKVYLRKIPIDPTKLWGADFRDWVDRGGRDLGLLESFVFKDLRPPGPAAVKTDFNGAFDCIGKHAQFRAQVDSIDAEGVPYPKEIELHCEMGSMPYCVNCKAMQRFANQIIHADDYPEEMAGAMVAKNFDSHVMKYVVGKPANCVHATLRIIEYDVRSKWTATQDMLEDNTERRLRVVSKECPDLTGDVQLTGGIYYSSPNIIVLADNMRQMDSAQIDLSQFHERFLDLCPYRVEDPGEIEAYIATRCSDLASNITKIYGRSDIHLAHELLVHSGLWMMVDGHRLRAWLDACIMGATRTGKSKTFQRLMEHHHLGIWQNCGENISRAGLTMGGERSEGGYRLRPGLFPRAHRKVLVLDEFHDIVKQDIMRHLQGARDEGKVYAAKVYGSRAMPACVRFAAIANFPHPKETFRFLVEHFQALYGPPECLSRMDFGLIIPDDPSDTELVDVPHNWTDDLVRALILRAWAMDESMIHFQPEAIKYAKQRCREWNGYYAADIPLFTPEEKHLTILRLAIAMANMMYSHPENDPKQCLVRRGHTVWAADYLERTWSACEYDKYSMLAERKKVLDRPIDVEVDVVIGMELIRPEDASALLPDFLGGFSFNQACNLLVKDNYETQKWLNKMMRFGLLIQSKSTRNGYYTEIKLTKAGDYFMRNLIMLADEFPDAWESRREALKQYVISKEFKFLPLTEPRERLRREWQDSD